MSERDAGAASRDVRQSPPSEPAWRADFPIRWALDHYVTRRELAKFLTLGSALLAAGNALIAAVGKWRRAPSFPEVRIPGAAAIPAGGSALFTYPTEEDPCILVRGQDGTLRAFSQVCTHLACAVIHRPESDELYCPCHRGYFSATDGRPTAGPPVRRLPMIRLTQRGDDVLAIGKEV